MFDRLHPQKWPASAKGYPDAGLYHDPRSLYETAPVSAAHKRIETPNAINNQSVAYEPGAASLVRENLHAPHEMNGQPHLLTSAEYPDPFDRPRYSSMHNTHAREYQ